MMLRRIFRVIVIRILKHEWRGMTRHAVKYLRRCVARDCHSKRIVRRRMMLI
jgi:hypothetical protein